MQKLKTTYSEIGFLRLTTMDYAAIGAVFAFASIQFVIGFNFHRTYMKLYEDFKEIIDKIDESRKNIFQDGLSTLVSNIQHSQQKDRPLFQLFPTTNLDITSKNEGIYSYVEHLVTQAREPIEAYSQARERSDKAYKWFIASGLLSLLAIFQVMSGDTIFLLVDLVIAFALLWAVSAWIDYNQSIRKLVRLRDACK